VKRFDFWNSLLYSLDTLQLPLTYMENVIETGIVVEKNRATEVGTGDYFTVKSVHTNGDVVLEDDNDEQFTVTSEEMTKGYSIV